MDISTSNYMIHQWTTKKLVVFLESDGTIDRNWMVNLCHDSIAPSTCIDSDWPIRRMASKCGYDQSKEPTEKDLKFLRDLKKLAIEYNDTPFEYAKGELMYYRKSITEKSFKFVYIDDEGELDKLTNFMDTSIPDMSYCIVYLYKGTKPNTIKSPYMLDKDTEYKEFSNYAQKADLFFYVDNTMSKIAQTYAWLLFVEQNLVPRLTDYIYDDIEDHIQLC